VLLLLGATMLVLLVPASARSGGGGDDKTPPTQKAAKAADPAKPAAEHPAETSAYSKLSEWPGGGIIGIRGTPQPQVLGTAASHGCVRVSNSAARTLERLVPVGTAISIVR
jgi:lipoprotein-anchoring transpeptidase ErfK/SrfK